MAKITTTIPNKTKYYLVRAGNNLTELRRWLAWAKKTSPKQKFIIVNVYKKRIKDKKHGEYWKFRYKRGLEDKYLIYGGY